MLGREPGSVDGASPAGEDIGAPLPLVEGLTGLGVGCDDDRSVGEKLGSEIGVFVGTLECVPVGDSETIGLSLGDVLGLEDTVGEKVGDDVGLLVGFSDGALLVDTVTVGFPLPDMLGCGEMVGANVGPGVGLFVGLILGDIFGAMLG